jgi:hypothetical protein
MLKLRTFVIRSSRENLCCGNLHAGLGLGAPNFNLVQLACFFGALSLAFFRIYKFPCLPNIQ